MLTAPNISASRAVTGACRLSSTSSRDPAEQVWPPFCRIAFTMTGRARSRSASANRMFGDFPPSSMVTGISRSAAAWLMIRPTSTDPVNEMWPMPGCAVSAAPADSPYPVTTFKAPGGSPASSARSPIFSAVSGASSAGLSTTQLPMARAGATDRPRICSG